MAEGSATRSSRGHRTIGLPVSEDAYSQAISAWALLWNFAPWHPATTSENESWRCPAERLN
jgi:hypothetical protein